MNDEVKQDVAKVEEVAATTGEKVKGWAVKLHDWFNGHPGAAVALAAGLVIGWVIGYLWPK